jgi:cytochrome c oxidase subunit 4
MSELHTEHAHDEHAHGDHAGLDKKRIWEVFFILLGITVVEFIIALWAIPGGHMSQHIGNFVYIVLTLFKAYYIIAYFMHLKFEKLGLKLAVSLVFLFILYFIVLMLIEGGYLHLHMPLV